MYTKRSEHHTQRKVNKLHYMDGNTIMTSKYNVIWVNSGDFPTYKPEQTTIKQ